MTWAELKERLDANGVTVELAGDVRAKLFCKLELDGYRLEEVYVLSSIKRYFEANHANCKSKQACTDPVCVAFFADKPVS